LSNVKRRLVFIEEVGSVGYGYRGALPRFLLRPSVPAVERCLACKAEIGGVAGLGVWLRRTSREADAAGTQLRRSDIFIAIDVSKGPKLRRSVISRGVARPVDFQAAKDVP
jgi:hypothetical protein